MARKGNAAGGVRPTGGARRGGAAKAGGAGGESGKMGRLRQVRVAYSATRKRDPRLPWILLGAFLVPLAVLVGIGVGIGNYVFFPILGVLLGLLAAQALFVRRAQRTAFAEMEGQPGAAAAVVQRMRGDWRVTPAVRVNRAQDVVSRVVCRAGVVLLAEGRGRGPRELLAAEIRRVKAVAGEAPIHDIIVGNGDGEVPLGRLQMTLMRKPRALSRSQVDALDKRLKALGPAGAPLPKGPIPRSARAVPRGKMR